MELSKSSSTIKKFDNININSFIREWCNDDDNDDYMECNFGKLNYRILSSLLIFIQKYNYECNYYFIEKNQLKINNILKDYLNECLKTKNIFDCITKHLDNIIKLYNFLKKIPPKIESNKKLIIYRGFHHKRHEDILSIFKNNEYINKDINVNDTITTCLFLSTDVNKKIAYRFASKNTSKISIIWKIIINKEQLHNFNYVYLVNDVFCEIPLQCSNINRNIFIF